VPCQTPFETLLGAPTCRNFIHSLLAPNNAMPKRYSKKKKKMIHVIGKKIKTKTTL
jgi:hypothetical protein